MVEAQVATGLGALAERAEATLERGVAASDGRPGGRTVRSAATPVETAVG